MGTARTPGEEALIVANGIYGPSTPGCPSNGPVDVQFNMGMHFTASDAVALVQRLVAQHDKPEIDHLIIHAGAPDADGWSYPAEELLGGFVIDQSDLCVQAEYLDQVTLHVWQPAVIATVPLRSTR